MTTARGIIVVACALLAAVSTTQACVYLLGEAPNSIAAHPKGSHWDYSKNGDNWIGVDGTNQSWVCKTGTAQSPISFTDGASTGAPASTKLRTSWMYPLLWSNGTNIDIINNGHTIQVQWSSEFNSAVLVPFRGRNTSTVLDVLSMNTKQPIFYAKATPLQFHFHTASEHHLAGMSAALELHIVHRIPPSEIAGCPYTGCLMVTGVLLTETEEDNPLLEPILAAASPQEGMITKLPKGQSINLQKLLPRKGKETYMQYAGSLTTPPCTEGLLWHVFGTTMTIGKEQLSRYYELVGFKECEETGNSTHVTESASADMHGRKLLHDHSHAHHFHPTAATAATDANADGSYYHPGSILVKRSTFPAGSSATAPTSAAASLYQGGRKAMETSPQDWTCDFASNGYDNRRVQSAKGRVIKNYPPV